MSDTTDPAGFDRAAAAGVHRISVPTPFAIGRVNVYLVDDDPLTLVDAGPNSGTSFDVVTQGVEALGHSLEQIGRIVVTHQHIDHIGLVGLIAARSGAEVAALEQAVPMIENYSLAMQADDDYAAAMMLRHGIPEDVVRALQSVSRAYHGWGAPAQVTRVLRDGDTLEFGARAWTVHWRPGHSPSDTIFEDRERRMLLAGDHLLGRVSSNTLITRPPDGSDERPRALIAYLASMETTRAMDLDLVLPGHGDPIVAHRALIEERFAMHRRRADKIHRLIAERPRSAHELAQALWGNIAVTQAYLTLSEILGHTDLLLADGRIREVADGDRVHFEAVAPAGS